MKTLLCMNDKQAKAQRVINHHIHHSCGSFRSVACVWTKGIELISLGIEFWLKHCIYSFRYICVSYKCRYIQERQESWIIFLSNKLPQKWDFSKYHEAHDFYYLLLEPFNLKYSGNSTQIVTVLPLLWKKKSCIQYQ